MKKVLTILFTAVIYLTGLFTPLQAQFTPEGIIYQAEARDDKGTILARADLEVEITIISGELVGGTVVGDPVWVGRHNVKTNEFGMFVIVIGEGESVDEFSLIEWGESFHFLKVRVKEGRKNSEWSDMGTTQFLSVPYALHAGTFDGEQKIKEDILANSEAIDQERERALAAESELHDYISLLEGRLTALEQWVEEKLAVPTLTTKEATSITSISVNSGGIIDDPNGMITAKGLCYSSSPAPTIDDNTLPKGTGDAEFDGLIKGLTPGTTYYIRAYATNPFGTGYGNEISFTTLATFPTLTTEPASSISYTTATSGGNITADGNGEIIARGVCWSTSANPTTADNKTIDGTGIGIFTSDITGLTPNTTYYVRAYATNSAVTAYGAQVSFTTAQSVNTTAISSITTSSAIGGGEILDQGNGEITARGVCWSTSRNPTTTGSKTVDGSGTGTFVSNITGLTRATKYYVRAYATNSVETSYGNELNFTTLFELPALNTTIIRSGSFDGTLGSTISDDGGGIDQAGFCWSLNPNPTLADSHVVSPLKLNTITNTTITGLAPSTTYYVRSYATNSAGTSYGTEVELLTTAPAVGEYDNNGGIVVSVNTTDRTMVLMSVKTPLTDNVWSLAKTACESLTDDFGNNDWTLPSREDLMAIQSNVGLLSNKLYEIARTRIPYYHAWSSLERDATYAFYGYITPVSFNWNYTNKNTRYNVIPVRHISY